MEFLDAFGVMSSMSGRRAGHELSRKWSWGIFRGSLGVLEKRGVKVE